MSDKPVSQSAVVFSQEDLKDPLPWVESLSEERLLYWIRHSLSTRDALPVVVSPNSRLAVEMSSLFKKALKSSGLKTRVRAVIPVLLQEWGRDDPMDLLDDLLILSGRLRCAAAGPVIVTIMTERLRDRPEAVAVRQRCLSVLSGFGCTERTEPIFKELITNVEYAAICYRALYRYDLRHAATELQEIVSIFQSVDALEELDIVIRNLGNDLRSPREFIGVLTQFLSHAEPERIVDVLEVMRGVGLLVAAPFVEARPSERVLIFKLLLERCPPQHLQDLLWKLDSIGLGLYSVELKNGQEYIQGVAYDPVTDRKVVDPVIATKDLNSDVVGAVVRGSEPIAASWAATILEFESVH